MSLPSITFPLSTKAEIKAAVKTLEKEMSARQAEINILSRMLEQCQNECDHKGQKTGYNERDGSWGNPCPTCGYSY